MSAGVEIPEETYVLSFVEPDYAAYVVRVRAPSLQEALDGIEASFGDKDMELPARLRLLEDFHRRFVSRVVEWNLTRGGEPVPVTFEGFRSLPPKFAHSLAGAWINGRTAVPRPLDEPSNDGRPQVDEASIPMETLSASLAS